MSTFAFIPRTVSKPKASTHPNRPLLSPNATDTLVQDHKTNVKPIKGKGKAPELESEPHRKTQQYSDEDYANLVCLALSDYALWLDPELRRDIDWSGETKSGLTEGQKFIPLTYLLKSSKILFPLQLWGTEVSIVKALRSQAAEILEVRLLVSDASTSSRTWVGPSYNEMGGYEIRRRSQEDSREHLSRSQWEERTVYMENIPARFRTVPGIARFSLALLSEKSTSSFHRTRIQNITLPPHHQDKPGDEPSCKGFAILVLASIEDSEFLRVRWLWDRNAKSDDMKDIRQSDEVQEAERFGFRTLSKLRWEELKQEYLAYRQRLVEEMVAFNDTELPPVTSSIPHAVSNTNSNTQKAETRVTSTPSNAFNSSYPTNSLIYVRNVHPETNKTTLRKFFAVAVREPLASGAIQTDGLDYVDFNKGMDTCYLRVTTPKHAEILVEYFTKNNVCQPQGLADSGTPMADQSKSISMELVLGRREELYWDKVPEKVRKEAVQRAINFLQTTVDVEGTESTYADPRGNESKKRKRRKH